MTHTFVANQNRDDQTVNGDDTRHNHRDNGSHNQLRSHDTHRSNTSTTFGSTVGSS